MFESCWQSRSDFTFYFIDRMTCFVFKNWVSTIKANAIIKIKRDIGCCLSINKYMYVGNSIQRQMAQVELKQHWKQRAKLIQICFCLASVEETLYIQCTLCYNTVFSCCQIIIKQYMCTKS